MNDTIFAVPLRRLLDLLEHDLFGSLGKTPNTDLQLAGAIDVIVASVDECVEATLDDILHVPAFQRLEGSWRGLRHLVEQVEPGHNIGVVMWSVSKTELQADLASVTDTRRTRTFDVVYVAEYGQFGGKPYGAVLVDVEVDHSPPDVALLRGLRSIGALAHVPFFLGAAPRLFGVSRAEDLRDARNLYDAPAHAAWRQLREEAESRYLGIAFARELARVPHEVHDGGLNYTETVSANGTGCVWKSPVYGVAERFFRVFARTGLLAAIVGDDADSPTPAVVPRSSAFHTPKRSLEVYVSPRLERELRDAGIVALQQAGDHLLFSSAHSLAAPRAITGSRASRDEAINYMLATLFRHQFVGSRFAHYLKVMGREVLGRQLPAAEIEGMLSAWLNRYVANQDGASPWVRATRPLRQARVRVWESQGSPFTLDSDVRLQPHVNYLHTQLSLNVAIPSLTTAREPSPMTPPPDA